MNHYHNKIAIVTGGASGIGRALCAALAGQGCTVIVADIDLARAREVAAALAARGLAAHAWRVNVAEAESVQGLVDGVAAAYGRLDLMFNNAGVSVSADARDLGLEHWRRVLDVNLWGVIHGAHAAYAVMARQGHGHIVNTASLSGLIPFPTNAPYCATKHAVVGLSQTLRLEGAGLGVRVSVVCPGYIQSNIFQSTQMLGIPPESRAKLLAANTFGLMDTDKAAQAILRAVARNQGVIVFPGYARLMWWLYRLNLALLNPVGAKMIADFRKLRAPEGRQGRAEGERQAG